MSWLMTYTFSVGIFTLTYCIIQTQKSTISLLYITRPALSSDIFFSIIRRRLTSFVLALLCKINCFIIKTKSSFLLSTVQRLYTCILCIARFACHFTVIIAASICRSMNIILGELYLLNNYLINDLKVVVVVRMV